MIRIFYSNIPNWVAKQFKKVGYEEINITSFKHRLHENTSTKNILTISTENINNYTQLGNMIDNIYLKYQELNIEKIIFLSNYSVYEPKYQIEYGETDHVDPYSFIGSKNIITETALSLLSKRGIRVLVLRLFNLYGPGQGVPFVIPDFIQKIIKNQVVKTGDMKKTRDFIYIDDFIDVLKIIEHTDFKDSFNTFNIGSGTPTTIKELVNKVEKIVGKNSKILFSPEYIRDEYDYDYVVSDITKTKKLLNWEPKITLEAGLKLTFEWLSGRSQI